MTDPASQPIPDTTAALIERAVRGDLSPDERARLDELAGADPVVADELERAEREEEAMNTAAGLFTQQSDPERMRMAIEQKLKLDRRGLRLMAGGFIAFVVLFSLAVARERWPWGVLAPIALCLIWWSITERRLWSFRRTLPLDDAHIAREFRRHLSRSRNGIVLNRAAAIIIALGLALTVFDHIAAQAYSKAAFVAACWLIVLLCAWRTLFNREYQQRYDQFLQGRLTAEDLFDKRADRSGVVEPDTE